LVISPCCRFGGHSSKVGPCAALRWSPCTIAVVSVAIATAMSPAKAKTVHGGDSFACLTSIHPAQGKTPDANVICLMKVRPRRVLRLWDSLCKRLTRWSKSRSKDEPLRRPFADVSLNHSSPKGGDSRDSTTKKGNAFPFIMLEDGTPMPHNEVLKLGLVRFKGAPARRRRETWTVHGGDTFASLSCRPQHTAKQAFSATAENLSAE